jgi:hypothetical protein
MLVSIPIPCIGGLDILPSHFVYFVYFVLFRGFVFQTPPPQNFEPHPEQALLLPF